MLKKFSDCVKHFKLVWKIQGMIGEFPVRLDNFHIFLKFSNDLEGFWIGGKFWENPPKNLKRLQSGQYWTKTPYAFSSPSNNQAWWSQTINGLLQKQIMDFVGCLHPQNSGFFLPLAFRNAIFSEEWVFWKPVKILLMDYKGHSIWNWASKIWSFNLCFGVQKELRGFAFRVW